MLALKSKLGMIAGALAVSSGVASASTLISQHRLFQRNPIEPETAARFRLSFGRRFQSGWPIGRCAARRGGADFRAPHHEATGYGGGLRPLRRRDQMHGALSA